MPVHAATHSDDPFETMRQSFREETQERLDDMDKLVEDVLEGTAPLDTSLRQLRRDTHTLKGMGDASGFPVVSMVAYRLESYLDDLDMTRIELALLDIRAHIDAMEDAVGGKSQSDDTTAQVLRNLPMPRVFNPDDIELRNVEALLVTSSRVVGRLLARDLAACGIRAVLTQSPTEALTLAIRTKPDLIIVSATMAELPGTDVARALASMAATNKIPVAILTSLSQNDLAKQGLPAGIQMIRTGEHVSEDLAAVITSCGIG